jgi:hypothetical protein
MRNSDPKARSTGGIPRLYQKYVGHDNNRDFYMFNQPESTNMARIQYHEWFPQIVYNHHQTGPAGTVMFAPPFRDPFNYNFDPLVPLGVDRVGAAMHNRFAVEGKPGVTMRTGAPYSTWWNGGLRTTVYFHNMIGLLTETIGNPTPMQIPLVPEQQLPRADLPFPIAPQEWHFRQSIDYSVTANYAVFDVASREKEHFLYNIYRMGANAIERGSRDSWTASPKDIARLEAQVEKDREAASGNAAQGGGGRFGRGAPVKYFNEILRDPTHRDARGYILPSDQADFLTAVKFINALRKANVAVERATRSFTVAGKTYPEGSLVVMGAQAFRPYLLDMFEPQDHPNDFAYPGGPPKRPYDNAGWTLAFQMGVEFDRILDGFECPCTPIEGYATPPAGQVASAQGAAGFLLGHETNDAFIAVNRALKAGGDVYWLRSPITAGGKSFGAGTFYIGAKSGTVAMLQKLASEKGLNFTGTSARPAADAVKLAPRRIALWDRYGGSMPSGHTRWLLEQFEFPFEVVYPAGFDAGNLASKYDVLVFVDGAIPSGEGGGFRGFGGGGPDASEIPAEFRNRLGNVTVEKTVPKLKEFLEAGGTIVTIGGSTALGYHLGLPISNHMVERTATGEEEPLPSEKYYVPGSILQVHVSDHLPVTAGMPHDVDVMFDESPVFTLGPDAANHGVRPIAWFNSATPLRSGWAWGQGYLEGGVTMAQADVGKGTLYLFGPEILFRATPAGTFKLFFNSIYWDDPAGGGTAMHNMH